MPPTPSPSSRRAGPAKLAGCVVAIAGLWLVVLPALGRHPVIREQIESNRAFNVDAGARFYTELPDLAEFLDRVHIRKRRAGEAFWRPSSDEKSASLDSVNSAAAP